MEPVDSLDVLAEEGVFAGTHRDRVLKAFPYSSAIKVKPPPVDEKLLPNHHVGAL